MYFFSFTYGWKKGGGSESLQKALTAWMSLRGAVTCISGLQAWLPAESPAACSGYKELQQERYLNALSAVFSPNSDLNSA